MRAPFLRLDPKLSRISWISIETCAAAALVFLPFSKSLAEIFCSIALVAWILRKFLFGEPLPRLRPVDAAYTVLAIAILASLRQAGPDLLETAARGAFKWAKYLGLFWMSVELGRRPGALRRLSLAFLVSAALAALNGYYQMIAGTDLVKGYSIHIPGRFTRMKSSFGSPNGLAAFLGFALPLYFERARAARGAAARWAWAAAGAIVFGAFIWTLSRAAVFALGAAALIHLARNRRWRAAAALALSPALFLLAPTLRENFLTSLTLSDITIGERLRYWDTTWRMISAHPFLGNGVNLYFTKFTTFAPAAETYHGYAHNCYLQIWAEIGIFGLIAFLLPIALFAGRAWTGARGAFDARAALAIAFAAFLIHASFDNHFFSLQLATFFWIFFGLWHSPLSASESRPAAPISPSRG